MSQVTKIANIETSTAIWEFDPDLPNNRLQGNTLDVVSAVRTLAIKIQASDQRISYFERLQVECGIDKPLKIPLHSNVRWGTAYGMLERSYQLRQVGCNFHIVESLITRVSFHLQAINLFICSADELFGPITTTRSPTRHISWISFALKPSDWERLDSIRCLIEDANLIQQYFSHETKTTLWRAIPAIEELQTAWEEKLKSVTFLPYRAALRHGLDKLKKYYYKFDDKPVYVLALGNVPN